MDVLQAVTDFLLHFDRYLDPIIRDYGGWAYLLLFLIIFCETGLVVTPFLPGDSLLFVAGAFAAVGSLNVAALFALFSAAAIAGDAVNYLIGGRFGRVLDARGEIRFVKRAYLERTARFFDRHGGKTIVFARFMPVVRTLAPFVAGASRMAFRRFLNYAVIGGILWVSLFTAGGYFFGNLPYVRDNFSTVIIGVVILSLLPSLFFKGREK